MKKEIVPKKGINSLQLKYLGVIFMTIDHIGSYVLNSTMSNHPFRIIGRIAAPLFLYVVIISANHTKSKLKFAFRLYIAHIFICLVTLFLTTIWKEWFGIHDQFSILSSFIYTVLLIWAIENIVNSIKKNNKREIIIFLIFIAVIIMLPIAFFWGLGQYETIYSILIPNILTIPYSPLFVLMGICWYFIRYKESQIFILILFSFFALFGGFIVNQAKAWIFMDFFNLNQFWMILFFPFIYLYNNRLGKNKKGKSLKHFFYIYYPCHVFILMFIGHQLR